MGQFNNVTYGPIVAYFVLNFSHQVQVGVIELSHYPRKLGILANQYLRALNIPTKLPIRRLRGHT